MVPIPSQRRAAGFFWLGLLGALFWFVVGATAADSTNTSVGENRAAISRARVAASDNDLVAHWRFDDASGTKAQDASGNGHTATLHEMGLGDSHWVAGRVEGGIRFGQTNRVTLIPDAPALNFTNRDSFSLAVWIRSEGEQVESAGLICKGVGSGQEQYVLDIYNNRIRFFVRAEFSVPVYSAITDIAPNGRWQHLAVTYEYGGYMTLYVNGRQSARVRSNPEPLFRTDHPVSIGARESNSGSDYNLPFKGVIDDVRIYRRALSTIEVRELYNSADLLPTIIYAQPANAQQRGNEIATFTTLADGMEPLTYQWRKNDSVLTAATNSVLRIVNIQQQDAGAYSVVVSSPNGVVTSVPATLTVIPFFWQTWWFGVAVLLGILLSIGGVFHILERQKVRRVLERLEKMHAVDRERMRIARDVHDEIGGKLSRISFLSDMARRGVADDSLSAKQIDQVSDAARAILESVDEIVWAANPRNDTVESLAHYICRHAENFFETTMIEVQIELPGQFPAHQLSAEIRHNLFCAVKEAFNNVLRHSQATQVHISFFHTKSTFRINIADNGKGFDMRAVSAWALVRPGTGVAGIQERLRLVRGSCVLTSAPGNGTSWSFEIPLVQAEPSPKLLN